MIRIFNMFVDWCVGHALHAEDYEIVIVPRTANAEAHLKRVWLDEFQPMMWGHGSDTEFFEGRIAGVPFRIEQFGKRAP